MHVGGYHFFEVPFRMIIFIIIEECSTVELFLYHTKKDIWFIVHSGNRDQTPEKGKREKNEKLKHEWKEETGREWVIWRCVEQESPQSAGTAGDVVGDGCNLAGTRD